ncbi:GRAM domain-containing protein 4-like [Sycon ciliatum]|uniref:GRAM domain-containing protein 4-like n=1 Tax=Sycon ciliatum TaxID=27933 RepID=UPI0031F64A72
MAAIKERLKKARLSHRHHGRDADEDDDDQFDFADSPTPRGRSGTGTSNSGTPDLSRKSSSSSMSGRGQAAGGGESPQLLAKTMSSNSRAAWDEAEKMIYEQQLEQLQDQLESVMIEKEKLSDELRALQSMEAGMWARQLEEERQRSLELSLQVEDLQQRSERLGGAGSSSDASDVDTSWVPVNEHGQTMPSLPPPSSSAAGVRQRRMQLPSADGSSSTGEVIPETGEDSDSKPLERFKNYVISKVCVVLADFTVDGDNEESEAEPEELSFNRLKGNWKRFWDDTKPIVGFFKSINSILHWDNWTTSLACFLLYMYTVWLGLLVPSILFVAICWLSFSYLKTTGILLRFAPANATNGSSESEDGGSGSGSSSRSYWQLVTQVAQKVQNTSGNIGDSLEKFYNLLAWHHPEATKKLYIALWTFFLISCVLPEAVVFRIAGLFFGYKFFVERSVYRRFPKVKAKYDTVSKIWEQLPTNSQLEAFTALRAHRQRSSQSGVSDEQDGGDLSGVVTAADQQFCERFSLSLDQAPSEYWKSGCHCRLIDKERPLTSFAMPGKLYITPRFLCFERTFRLKKDHTDADVKHSLTDIVDVKKAKAFQRLPGHGMAIEVQVQGLSKPLIFGAILNRHEVLQKIMEAGRNAGLTWGYPPGARPPPS